MDQKELRKQLRIILRDVLPEVLTSELVVAVEKKLRVEMNDRLNKIDERQKDVQSFLVRNSLK